MLHACGTSKNKGLCVSLRHCFKPGPDLGDDRAMLISAPEYRQLCDRIYVRVAKYNNMEGQFS